MTLKGKLSLLFNYDHATLTIRDDDAAIDFVIIKLDADQVMRIFSNQMAVPCEITVRNLDHVGKKMEWKKHEFALPYWFGKISTDPEFHLLDLAQKSAPDGWIVENYFEAQDSFFIRDGKKHARCTIRRWI